MYCSFYGIQEKPFSITPDPKYLYLGKTHQEAFAHLVYGIRERGGFIVVTGDIGTGKTTLCRALLTHLDADIRVAFVFNPTLSALDLLKTINDDLGIRSEGDSQKELIDALNRFLLDQRQQGKNTVLIIDEAQNLDMEVLEHVRLLSNLETDTEKLLQIILVGQPEFRQMLEQPRLEQLNQRVTVRYHLNPLSREETEAYVNHRLAVAGADEKIRFTPEAIKRIGRYTRGVPRLINVLCDRALLAGYTRRTRRIDGGMVKQAQREVAGKRRGVSFARFLGVARGGLVPGLLLAVIVLLVAYGVQSFLLPGKHADLRPETHTVSVKADGSLPVGAAQAGPVDAVLPGVAEDVSSPAPLADAGALGGESPIVTFPMAVDAWKPPVFAFPHGEVEWIVDPLGQARRPGEPERATAARPGEPLPPGGPPHRPERSAAFDRERSLETFREMLASRTIHESLQEAFTGVVEQWDRANQDGRSRAAFPAGGDIYAAARSAGFLVLRLQGNYDTILALGLPAVLELKLSDILGRRYVALLGMQGDSAAVRPLLADGSERIPGGILEELWHGTAYVLWKDWVGGRPILMQGMRGEEVGWLQSVLIELGYLSGVPTGFFDGNTSLAVRNFQSAGGLDTDGILGPQTKIALFHSLGRFRMPSLEAGGRS